MRNLVEVGQAKRKTDVIRGRQRPSLSLVVRFDFARSSLRSGQNVKRRFKRAESVCTDPIARPWGKAWSRIRATSRLDMYAKMPRQGLSALIDIDESSRFAKA